MLLAAMPATLCAQTIGGNVVIRKDTVVVSTGDTVIVERLDTIMANANKPQTMPMPLPGDALGRQPVRVMPVPNMPGSDSRTTLYSSQALDSIIARAVQLGVQKALAERDGGIYEPDKNRTGAERIWDRLQEKRRIKRVPRDLLKATFIPKGEWLLGGTLNFQEWDTDNINLLVLKNIEFEGRTISASPYFGYFVANNIAIGGRYNYNRNYLFLGNLDLNLGEDFNISLDDLYYLAHTHTVSTFVRTYQSLGKSNIFGFFGEIRASYAYSREKNTTGSGMEYEGSFARSHSLQLTFCPGVAAFVTDFLAAEASIGVMGLKYRWKDQHTNREEKGRSESGGANFKFNFLSISLGLTFYL